MFFIRSGVVIGALALAGGLTLLWLQIRQVLHPTTVQTTPSVSSVVVIPEIIKAVLGGPTWFVLFGCGAALVAGGIWLQALIAEKVFVPKTGLVLLFS